MIRRTHVAILVVVALLAHGSVAASFEVAPLTTKGPGDSTFTLSASNRVRGEFADWFEAGPPDERGVASDEHGAADDRLEQDEQPWLGPEEAPELDAD
jgi:hypothetical protein